MAMQAGIAVPAYDLGQGPTAMLPHNINPLLLQQICTGVEGLPQTIDCEGGFPAQVKLVVKAGGDEVVSVRTLRLRFGTSEPNANPRIDGLTISLPDMVADLPIGETPEVTIPRAEDVAAEGGGAAGDGRPSATPARTRTCRWRCCGSS